MISALASNSCLYVILYLRKENSRRGLRFRHFHGLIEWQIRALSSAHRGTERVVLGERWLHAGAQSSGPDLEPEP